MGKYMRKAKLSGEVAVMEVPHQSSLGVRTRARTLAALHSPAAPDASFAYLELRSRRLEKPLTPSSANSNRQPKDVTKHSPKPSAKGSAGSVSLRQCSKRDESAVPDVEVFFGENVLEPETGERFIRETTPCSPIRGYETGSTTRRTKSTLVNRRIHNPVHLNSPIALEMEEFFVGAEQLQQRLFMERYNFDPVNDNPLPGRYEWVKLDF